MNRAYFNREGSGPWTIVSETPLVEGHPVSVYNKTGISARVVVGKFIKKHTSLYEYEIENQFIRVSAK